MGPEDREYFMARARQERAAAAASVGEARERHEELACLYEMRVTYIDRGLAGNDAEAPPQPAPQPIQHITILA